MQATYSDNDGDILNGSFEVVPNLKGQGNSGAKGKSNGKSNQKNRNR